MEKRKYVVVLCILIAAFAVYCGVCSLDGPSGNTALVWRIIDTYPHTYYFAVNRIQDCCCGPQTGGLRRCCRMPVECCKISGLGGHWRHQLFFWGYLASKLL